MMWKKDKQSGVSNPLKSAKNDPLCFISFKGKQESRRRSEPQGLNVMVIDDKGLDRETRKAEILKCLPCSSAEEARTVESLVNRTAGLNENQLNSLLNYVKLKRLTTNDRFLNIIEEKINNVWLEEVLK